MSNTRTTSNQNKIIDVLKRYENKNTAVTLELLKKEMNMKDIRNSLGSLLYKEKINISGYSCPSDKSNKFNQNNICFERRMSHKTFSEILSLLYQLENPKIMKKAYDELSESFEKKFRQYEEQEESYWEELKNKVESMPLKSALKELEKELLELENNNKQAFYEFKKEESIEYFEYYSKIYKKHKNAKIWYFENLSRENIHKILNINLSTPIKQTPQFDSAKSSIALNQKCVVMGKTQKKRAYTTRELAKISVLKNHPLIDEEGSWTLEIFLKEKGLEKPKRRDSNKIKKTFRDLLFFINSLENNRFMKNAFSLALSNDEESLEFFEQFIKDFSYILLSKQKLGEELTSLKPDYRNAIYMENAMAHENFHDKVNNKLK